MRVYASSPLYSLAELVFRSKRLFIAAMLVATLATVLIYAYRSGTYTATALVLLSGTQTGTAPESVDESGTIHYKLNVLNIVLKNPYFFRDAMHEAHLDSEMDAMQFDKFCQDVRNSMSYANSENVLEISCRWQDDRAAAIVRAFWNHYQQIVMEQETVGTTRATEVLTNLLKEYTQKQDNLELAVAKYDSEHATNPPLEPPAAFNQYQQQLGLVKTSQRDLAIEQKKLNDIQTQLAHTKETLPLNQIRQGPGEDPDYLAALKAKQDAADKLQALQLKYTSNAPSVKEAQAQLDAANANLAKYSSAHAGKNSKPGIILREQEGLNPAYTDLQQRLEQETITVGSLQAQLADAQQQLQEAQQKAINAPKVQYDYRRMTDDLALFTSIHQNLSAKLEQAKMDEKRDKALKVTEMTLMVPPVSEPERSTTKGLLMLASGPLLGLIIAFAFSLLAESLDHSLRTPLDVEKHLGKPVLAVLPNMKPARESARRHLGGEGPQPTLPST